MTTNTGLQGCLSVESCVVQQGSRLLPDGLQAGIQPPVGIKAALVGLLGSLPAGLRQAHGCGRRFWDAVVLLLQKGGLCAVPRHRRWKVVEAGARGNITA